jgi:hypothetical protein
MQMQKHFQNSTKIVFLEENGTFLTGLELSEEPKTIDTAFLQVYSRYYQEKNYSLILGNNYKMMIFSVKVIEELPNLNFQFSEYIVSKNNALLALRENDSLRYIVPDSVAPISLDVAQNEQNDFLKASIFSVMLTEGIMNPQDPLYFFEQYKKGNIFVYPETAVFKSIKLIPISLIQKVAEKASNQFVKQEVVSVSESSESQS